MKTRATDETGGIRSWSLISWNENEKKLDTAEYYQEKRKEKKENLMTSRAG